MPAEIDQAVAELPASAAKQQQQAQQQQQQQQQQAAPKSKLASSLDTMHRIKRAYSTSGSRGAPPQRKPSYSGNGDAGNGYSTPQRPPPEEEHMITIKVGLVHTCDNRAVCGVTHCSKRQGSCGVWLCSIEGSCSDGLVVRGCRM